METSDLLRHQMIRHLMAAQHTEKVADTAMSLWVQMATQIIAIVGKGGFDSLFARSVFLAQATFPWLATVAEPSKAGSSFVALKMRFEEQSPAQTQAANSLLLITFTDILASLIGEQLTTSILHSAWGNDASMKADKESHYE